MTESTYLGGIMPVIAHKAIQACITKELKKFALTPSQWFILGAVHDKKAQTNADMADLLKVDPPLVTKLTNELAEKKLLDKQNDPDDKRTKKLFLTSHGQYQIKKIEPKLKKSLEKLLVGVSASDMQAYKKVLQAIIKNS